MTDRSSDRNMVLAYAEQVFNSRNPLYGLLSLMVFGAMLPFLFTAFLGLYLWVEFHDAHKGVIEGWQGLKAKVKRGQWY